MTTRWPTGFTWGVSTSSYQIEGAVAEDGRKPSIWDTRCRTPGKVANGDTGDIACDHYHRFGEDTALMHDLHIPAYRFSVAWPRVLPNGKGATNEVGLAFYDRLIDGLLAAGIEPWLCLYHWDLPQALEDLGGWTNRDIVGWFADYAALLARRYGDRVKRWATINEPSVFTLFGYAMDWSAPGQIDRTAHLKAIHHVNLAHGVAVDTLRALVPGARVGCIHNRQRVIPESNSDADAFAARKLHAFWNDAFPEPQLNGVYPAALADDLAPFIRPGDMARISRPCDYFGLNHYGPIFAKADPAALWGFAWGGAPADAPKSDIGWPIFPDMFRDELIDLSRRYRLPIYVTENGCGGRAETGAEIDDPHRIKYLSAYIRAMRAAIAAGADVRGYFVWSLLDNFEWGSGYSNRFGLVFVDFATGKRTVKASGRWFSDLIAGRVDI
ncbi:GH1 family beta-glucosidase [Dongia sp.]|uniref:GH1 family beta-glucosidase n=1 Tax=Dongia sp. TaxID=1977262 RepID=UPI0035B35E7A